MVPQCSSSSTTMIFVQIIIVVPWYQRKKNRNIAAICSFGNWLALCRQTSLIIQYFYNIMTFCLWHKRLQKRNILSGNEAVQQLKDLYKNDALGLFEE